LDFQEQSIPEKQRAPIPYYISLLYHRVEKLLDDQDCLILVSTLQANLQRQSGACVGRFQHAAGFVSEITCKSQRGRITLPGLNAQQTRTPLCPSEMRYVRKSNIDRWSSLDTNIYGAALEVVEHQRAGH
jgi:hypothetical protein